MNRSIGPLLLAWMVGAGMPASAQYSSLSQTTANRRQPPAPGAVESGSANASPQTRAHADAASADLAAEEATLAQTLKQTEKELRSSSKALKRGEAGVSAGLMARSSVVPLRAKVRRQQLQVESLRQHLARVRARRATQDRQVSRLNGGAGSARPAAADNSERTRLLSQRIRQLLTAQSSQTGGASRVPQLYPEAVPAAPLAPPYRSLQSAAAQAETNAAEAMARQSAAQAELRVAAESHERVKQQYAAGQVTQAELSEQEARVVKARAGLEAAQSQVERSVKDQQQLARLATLQRPIDVELHDAPVRQAAHTISQASGLTIEVADSVPAQTRLTVAARGVALATVLDTIARESHLFIVPARPGNGIELQPAPTLDVNGQRTEIITPFAPWSPEWEMNPAASMGYSVYGTYRSGGNGVLGYLRRAGGGQGSVWAVTGSAADTALANPPLSAGTVTEKPAASLPAAVGTSVSPLTPGGTAVERPSQADPYQSRSVPLAPGYIAPPRGTDLSYNFAPGEETSPGVMQFRAGNPTYGGFGGSFDGGYGGAGAASVIITALNDSTFVVANPAAGPGGEPAVMLTVYRLQGAQLRIVSTTLHRLGPGGGARDSRATPPDVRYRPGVRYGNPGDIPANPQALPSPRFAPAAPPAAVPAPDQNVPSTPRAP
jgi:hypothetical protein